MHRCARYAAFVGSVALSVVFFVVVLSVVVVSAIVVLPFLLLFVLDQLIGERAPTGVLTIVPPAPPHQPRAMPAWTRRAA